MALRAHLRFPVWMLHMEVTIAGPFPRKTLPRSKSYMLSDRYKDWLWASCLFTAWPIIGNYFFCLVLDPSSVTVTPAARNRFGPTPFTLQLSYHFTLNRVFKWFISSTWYSYTYVLMLQVLTLPSIILSCPSSNPSRSQRSIYFHILSSR